MSVNEVFAIIGGALVTGVLALLGVVRKAEIDRRKPETIAHNCRVAGLDVYTFIKRAKEQTPPLCLYLDSSDYVTCRFKPENTGAAHAMKEIHNGKCYIALFNSEFKLK